MTQALLGYTGHEIIGLQFPGEQHEGELPICAGEFIITSLTIQVLTCKYGLHYILCLVTELITSPDNYITARTFPLN